VYEVTIPSNHITIKITKIVINIMCSPKGTKATDVPIHSPLNR